MTQTDFVDALLDREFVFRERPIPTAGDLRPVWRVPIVLLLVEACRGKQATHEQLHVLNWAVRSAVSAETLGSFLAGDLRPEQAIVRFEPALDRAASLARGFGLLAWEGRYWSLTPSGRETVEMIHADDDVLRDEKELLGRLPGPLTQASVQQLFRRQTT